MFAASLLVLILVAIWIMPSFVAALRGFSFAQSEGRRGYLLPNKEFDAEAFRNIYSSPHARIRSKGSHFADLVWYLLAPGSHMHQEVMEEGPVYDGVAAVTKKLIAIPSREANEIITGIVEKYFERLQIDGYNAVHLRDLFMPIWAQFFFELLFRHKPTEDEVAIIVDNARDFIECTKFHKLPNMVIRQRVVDLIGRQIRDGHFAHEFTVDLTQEEKCFYLRGLFLTSGVIQLAEALAHILLCLSRRDDLQKRLATSRDRVLLSNVIDESMRLYPLFGVAFRITSSDIVVSDGKTLRKDSVVFFQHQKYQQQGFDRPKSFDPGRWLELRKGNCHFVPFGESKNHPCPAGGLSKIVLGRCVELVLERYRIYSSATHTRALANRGPCLLVTENYKGGLAAALTVLFLKDRFAIFWLSLKQLFVGFEIKRRAKKLRLATQYFERK